MWWLERLCTCFVSWLVHCNPAGEAFSNEVPPRRESVSANIRKCGSSKKCNNTNAAPTELLVQEEGASLSANNTRNDGDPMPILILATLGDMFSTSSDGFQRWMQLSAPRPTEHQPARNQQTLDDALTVLVSPVCNSVCNLTLLMSLHFSSGIIFNDLLCILLLLATTYILHV